LPREELNVSDDMGESDVESEASAGNNEDLTVYLPSASNTTPRSCILRGSALSMQNPVHNTQGFKNALHHAEYFNKGLQFLDANSLTASKQE
jgi:hypothetical protein